MDHHPTIHPTLHYENDKSLAFSVWGRSVNFESKHGCTIVKISNISDFVYVLRIDKSCQGRWEDLRIYIFSSPDEVVSFVKRVYSDFVHGACYHCGDFIKPSDLNDIINNLIKNKETGFEECQVDYGISYFKQKIGPNTKMTPLET